MKRISFHAVYDDNNLYHFLGSMLLAVFFFSICVFNFGKPVESAREFAFYIAWGLGWLWEVGDYFKPNWTRGLDKPLWKQLIFYSDGFSVWDVMVPDLIGVLVGLALTFFFM